MDSMSSYVRYSSVASPGMSNRKEEGVIRPILKPMAIFLVGGLLAVGHHFFNSYANNKPLDFPFAPSQVWMNRIGTAFAFGFKAALSTSLTFVLCQLMWLTLRRKFLTFSEIDTAYLTANRNIMATFFSSSFVNSPLLVLTGAVSLLLPIPTIFPPSSLQVVPGPIQDLSLSCQVPTGNLTNGTTGSIMYQTGGAENPTTSPTLWLKLTYSVSVPSIAFQCKEGVELPVEMKPATPATYYEEPFWNASVAFPGGPRASFYVYWKSTTMSGTNGTALCTVGTAKYDFTIRNVNGQESVTYNVTYTGDLIDTGNSDAGKLPLDQYHYAMQLSSISSATRSLLLGTISLIHTISGGGPHFDSPVISAAFFDSSLNSGNDYTWGDVPRGIEQLSHNVSAAILTMNLGVKDSTCIVSRQDIIYEYNRFNLWLPYGVALFMVSMCLILGITVFFKLNPENLTASFTDTVSITRNPTLNMVANTDSTELRFRLGRLKNGYKGFGMREEMKLE